ncbi:MAG: GntR family transcriptional regulator [Granulosicoccus sp.]
MNKHVRPQGRDTYARILNEIRAGTLNPGDRLTEADIAERLGISRTPVREAMRQLEADGLISHTPRSGSTIRKLDYSEVSELYEMRAVLESTAARFSARAASDVEVDELVSIHQAMCAATDTHELDQLNQQFHRCLLDAARNRFLLSAVRSIEKTLLILGPSTFNESDRAAQSNKEHEQLLNAISARNPADAEQAMRQHIESAHRVRLRQLRQNGTSCSEHST